MTENPKGKPPFIEKKGKTLLLEPQSGKYLPTANLKAKFADLSRSAPRNRRVEHAFIAGKIRLAKAHARLAPSHRDAVVSGLRSLLPSNAAADPQSSQSAVGYGVFYQDPFRSDFATGTALAVDFLAPTKPGGNVSAELFLTATNRAAKGVEAYVQYMGQNDLRLRVWDWARVGDYRQINIGYGHLDDYLTAKYTHGVHYQVLSLQNQTYVKTGGKWVNNVWLQNYRRGRYDLIYSHEYTSSEAGQKDFYYGSWGPIVETFQGSYSNTNLLGCLGAYLQGRDAQLQWTQWQLLSPQQSVIYGASAGFQLLFLQPNHSFGVY